MSTGLLVAPAAAGKSAHPIDRARVLESGAIDALFLCKHGWKLTEFKTDKVTDRLGVEGILAKKDDLAQVSRYLRAAQELLRERPRPVLCLLSVDGRVLEVQDRR